MNDQLAEQLETIIASVVTRLEEQNVLIINPVTVSKQVDDLIDPDNASPPLKTYASTMQIRQSTRAYLRNRHDPVARMEKQIEEGTDDMFADHIQDYYPVKRDGLDGYAKRDTLTEIEITSIAKRLRKSALALQRHADALVAWFESKAA